MDKINYYNVSLAEINKFKMLENKPTLALHACCAPCSSHTLEFVTQFFDVTIVYENSNVYPEKEFLIRRNEVEWFVEAFNKRNNRNVKVVFLPYDHEGYMADLRKYANEPEGEFGVVYVTLNILKMRFVMAVNMALIMRPQP